MNRVSIGSATQDSITVVLIDDHEMIRLGIRTILEQDSSISVVGEAANSREAISLIKSLQPDVVILDIRLDLSNGIDVSKAIPIIAPDTKTLVFTAYDDDQYVSSMVRLGISGYLLKTSSAEELRAAIYDVAKGRLIFPSEIASKVMKLLKSNRDDVPDKRRTLNLTPRECEILSYIGKGLKDKDIAEILGISLRTVETHVRNLLNKLGVSSRTQAALKSVNREV